MGSALESAIFFTEVGPRDGLQNLDREIDSAAKVDLIEGLLATGVDQVEATAFVSPDWVPQLADADQVLAQLAARGGPDALARIRVLVPNRRGLERALAAGAARVIVNVGATDSFNRRNLNRPVRETLTEIERVAELAASSGSLWDASISVAFGCPFEGPVRPEVVLDLAGELAGMGAAEISVADTIGVADPDQVGRMVELLGQRLPFARLALHLHDTRGLGLANALVAYRTGLKRFEGSVGGLGGCPFAPRSTGNVCSEDLLNLLARSGAAVHADVEGLCGVAQGLEGLLQRQLPGRLYRAGPWPAPSPEA
ncbi:MAG: hydroxymethylglutaryl-CoA lyase [Candidatus Dormibacteria bacterium]